MYLVRDCENWSFPIQMPLSLKPKSFSKSFVQFLESSSHFKRFEIIVIANLFRKLQTVKDLVRPLSKKHRFRTPFDSQHLKRFPNSCKIFMTALSSHFFLTLGEPDLENISLSYTLDHRGVLQHIDCQWTVSCSRFWQFVVVDWNGIIFKTKKFL